MIAPDPVFGREAMPWARHVNSELLELRATVSRLAQGTSNTGDSLNTSIGVLADQVRRGVANSYSKAEVDAMFSATNGLIGTKANSVHGHDQNDISGTWSKGVNTGSDIVTSGNVYSTGAYNSDLALVANRRTMWVAPDGRFGHTASSRKFKQDIESFEWDYDSLRRVRVVLFRYIKAVDAFGDDAALEFGVIAEELHDLGLGFLVDYNEDGTPHSVHFHLFGFLAIYLAQLQGDMIDAIHDRLDALEAR